MEGLGKVDPLMGVPVKEPLVVEGPRLGVRLSRFFSVGLGKHIHRSLKFA